MTRASPRPYHHGDLKAALLEQAEAILESDGIPGLTLRAIARRAGVSHTAPNNHFDDLTGLLSELAAVGFMKFGAALNAATTQAGDDPRDTMKAMGLAYVGFARAHPGLFSLMFRSELLDPSRPALRDAIADTRTALRNQISARSPARKLTPMQIAARSTAVWSLVHGFAVLMLDGRLDSTINALPGQEDAGSLLDAVLSITQLDET
jgi:AcrR family transcriptional regulator